MPHHELCGKDEVWVGNTHKNKDHFKWIISKGLKTVRLGKVAYDIEGKPLKEKEGYVPVFINRSEENLHSEIMMKKTFGEYWNRR